MAKAKVDPKKFAFALKRTNKGYQSLYDLANQYSVFGEDRYTKEDILEAIENDDKRTLREFSSFLFLSNSYYRMSLLNLVGGSLLNYLAVPLMSDAITQEVIAKNEEKVRYYRQGIMNKRYLREIISSWALLGLYVGYERSVGKNYYLQHLNVDYCRVGSQVNGVNVVEFNFDYFRGLNDERFALFPPEFKTLYKKATRKGGDRWYPLDYTKTIVLECPNGFPILTGSFVTFIDEDSVVALTLDGLEVDNLKLIAMKLPIDDEGDILADLDVVESFSEMIAESVDQSISVVRTPYELDFHSFEENKMSSTSDKRNYLKERMMESTLGSPAMFGNADVLSGFDLFHKTLENILHFFNDQASYVFETKINQLTAKKLTYKVQFLDHTTWNRDAMFASAQQMLAMGGSVTIPVLLSTGLDMDTYTSLLQHEKMNGFKDLLDPPRTSSTLTAEDESNGDTNNVTTDSGEESQGRS